MRFNLIASCSIRRTDLSRGRRQLEPFGCRRAHGAAGLFLAREEFRELPVRTGGRERTIGEVRGPAPRKPEFAVLHPKIGQRRAFPEAALEQLRTIFRAAALPALPGSMVVIRLHPSPKAFVAASPLPIAGREGDSDSMVPLPRAEQAKDRRQALDVALGAMVYRQDEQ